MTNGNVDQEREEDTERVASSQEYGKRLQEVTNQQQNQTDYTM